MLLTSGSVVGPYEILSPLGAGNMGDVWKARDTRLNRIVAIKTLKGPHTGRFEQEARAIAAHYVARHIMRLMCRRSLCGRGQWKPPIAPVDTLIAGT